MTSVPKQVGNENYGRILTIVKGSEDRVNQVLQDMYDQFPVDLFGTAIESREINEKGIHTLTIVYFDLAYEESLELQKSLTSHEK